METTKMKVGCLKCGPKKLEEITKKIKSLLLPECDLILVQKILFLHKFRYFFCVLFNKPSYTSELMNTTIVLNDENVLDPDDEATLFIQMNFAKHMIAQLRSKIFRRTNDSFEGSVSELLEWKKKQLVLKEKITRANIGLVFSMMHKKVTYHGVDFDDMISEGCDSLLRAIDNFDYGLGFKFSTYACNAILRGFCRVSKKARLYKERFPVSSNVIPEKEDKSIQEQRDIEQTGLVDIVTYILSGNIAVLSEIEERVIRLRFGIDDSKNPQNPQKLREVGEKLGLTKERIRQIQNSALIKLREAIKERLFLMEV